MNKVIQFHYEEVFLVSERTFINNIQIIFSGWKNLSVVKYISTEPLNPASFEKIRLDLFNEERFGIIQIVKIENNYLTLGRIR